MAGISRYEKAVLGLTAGFVVFTGGWFFSERNAAAPYQVVTARQGTEKVPTVPPPATREGRPDSLLEGEVININTAGLYELQRLPGIGEKRAQAILSYREEYGPFRTVEQLDEVEGIGQGILAGLAEYVTVGEIGE